MGLLYCFFYLVRSMTPASAMLTREPIEVMTATSPLMKDSLKVDSRPQNRILVVEDEGDIADLLALHLIDLDAQVEIASDGLLALQKIKAEAWDAVLLDLRLPRLDGLDICREVRAEANYVPIMMLTSRDTELDRVLGLEIGADDYLTKPFSIPELKARVKALIRRSRHNAPAERDSDKASLSLASMQLDRRTRSVSLAGQGLKLTCKEFELLWFFASSPGEAFSRSELLDKVWGYGHDGYEHTVNSHINRLRTKLQEGFPEHNFIQTVWGVGYRFVEVGAE